VHVQFTLKLRAFAHGLIERGSEQSETWHCNLQHLHKTMARSYSACTVQHAPTDTTDGRPRGQPRLSWARTGRAAGRAWCRTWRRRTWRRPLPACPSRRPPRIRAPPCCCCRLVPASAAGAGAPAAGPRRWRPPPAMSSAAPTRAPRTTRRPGWTPSWKPWRRLLAWIRSGAELNSVGVVWDCQM